MANEQQDLELRVTLDDQATAQLEQIRNVLGRLGASPGGVSVVTGRMGEFERALGHLARSALGVGRASVELAKVIGPMPVALGTMAYQTMRVSEAMKEWATGLQQTGNMARQAGIGVGEFKNIVSQMRMSGVSAQTASQMIVQFTQAYGELMRVGSGKREALIQIAGPQFAGSMIQGIQLIGSLKTDTEKLNAIREMGENVYQNKLIETGDAMRAAAAREQFLAILNVSQLANLRQNIQQQDARTRANMEAEAVSADKLATALTDEQITRDRIWDIIKGSAATSETWITEQITFIEKRLLEGAEAQEKFKRENEHKREWWTRGAALWDLPADAWNKPAEKLISNPFHFQEGGIVTKPTVGLIGEAGPEAIIPLSQMDDVLGGGDPEAQQARDANTQELARLSRSIMRMLTNMTTRKGAGDDGQPVIVPGFSEGGLIRRPTYGVVGEHGPELVVPLGPGTQRGIGVVTSPSAGVIGRDGPVAIVPLDQYSRAVNDPHGNQPPVSSPGTAAPPMRAASPTNVPGPGRVPVRHSAAEIASWQPYFSNPLSDIEDELSSQRSIAREAIAGVGKQGGFGANALQVGKAAWESYKYASPTGTGLDAVIHTSLGRLAGGAVGGREQGNVVADVASPFIPGTAAHPAATALESAAEFARSRKLINVGEQAFNRIRLGLKVGEAAYKGVSEEPQESTALLDRMMGNQTRLKVGQSGQIKIVQENAPPGVSVEADGGILDGAEKETSRTFDIAPSAKWRHPDAAEKKRQYDAGREPYQAIDPIGIRG